MLGKLLEKCAGNSICVVEAFKLLLDEAYAPSQEEVKQVSSLIGEPAKRVEVFKSRYIDVFTRFLEKNCYYSGDRSLCIYSWNPRVPVRYFPVSLDATGTVLLFEGTGVSLVAYPTHRTHDLEGRGVELPDPEKVRVEEVTSRVDGYQVTLYFNPLLGRWVPATRYSLHNMRYVGKRVLVEELDRIVDPYAAVADYVAESGGLYERVKGMEGWTLTFVLEAPEPAILRPNVELYDYGSFRLHLVNAREPGGRLLTTSESSRLLRWESVPVEEVEVRSEPELRRLVDLWSRDLYRRSRFVRFASGDRARPYTVEAKSKLYESAVMVKHSSDPKSLIVLASHGFGDEAVGLLTDYGDVRSVGREICGLYEALRNLVSRALEDPVLGELLRNLRAPGEILGELEKARRSKDVDRFARKLSLFLSSESLHETRERLRAFVETLRRSVARGV